jgi:hypothetical protein
MKNTEYQEVEVFVSLSGDYCAFHEVSISITANITNNIIKESHTFDTNEEFFDYLNTYEFEGYGDYIKCKAIKIGDDYYYNINKTK